MKFIISSPDPGFIEIHPELANVDSKVPDFVIPAWTGSRVRRPSHAPAWIRFIIVDRTHGHLSSFIRESESNAIYHILLDFSWNETPLYTIWYCLKIFKFKSFIKFRFNREIIAIILVFLTWIEYLNCSNSHNDKNIYILFSSIPFHPLCLFLLIPQNFTDKRKKKTWRKWKDETKTGDRSKIIHFVSHSWNYI